MLDWYLWTVEVMFPKHGDDPNWQDITIFNRDDQDVTETFLIFGTATEIRPTAENLFQILDLLKTNYETMGGKNDDTL